MYWPFNGIRHQNFILSALSFLNHCLFLIVGFCHFFDWHGKLSILLYATPAFGLVWKVKNNPKSAALVAHLPCFCLWPRMRNRAVYHDKSVNIQTKTPLHIHNICEWVLGYDPNTFCWQMLYVLYRDYIWPLNKQWFLRFSEHWFTMIILIMGPRLGSNDLLSIWEW